MNSRSSLANLCVLLKCKLWGSTWGKKQHEKKSADSRARPPGLQPWLCLFLAECMRAKLLSHVQLCATPWTVARQVPLSMGFSRQEYWSGLSFLTPGYLPDPGVEPSSLMSPALAGGLFTTSAIQEAPPGWMATCKLLSSLWLGILFYSKGVKNWTYLTESSEAEMS